MDRYILFIAIALLLFSFIWRIILWSKLPPRRRVGLISSMFMWFATYEIHSASKPESKRFKKWNNTLNLIFWLSLALLAVYYVLSARQKMENLPRLPKKH